MSYLTLPGSYLIGGAGGASSGVGTITSVNGQTGEVTLEIIEPENLEWVGRGSAAERSAYTPPNELGLWFDTDSGRGIYTRSGSSWVRAGLQYPGTEPPALSATGAIGETNTTARGDHTHPYTGLVLDTAVGVSIATLVGGKIPSAQLPQLALTAQITVASEAEMLASGAAPGTLAIRSDNNTRWVLSAPSGDPTVLGDWINFTGSAAVDSVALGAGSPLTGDVVIPEDPVAATAGLRTLGTGAQQAVSGTDARLSDTRTPTDGTVTDAKVAADAAIDESKLDLASDAAAGTASRRTLGTGATQAAPGTLSGDLDALSLVVAGKADTSHGSHAPDATLEADDRIVVTENGALVFGDIPETAAYGGTALMVPVWMTGQTGTPDTSGTEPGGSSATGRYSRKRLDCTDYATWRASLVINTAGDAGSWVAPQYSTDDGTTWKYLDGSTVPAAPIVAPPAGTAVSGATAGFYEIAEQVVPEDAQALILWRVLVWTTGTGTSMSYRDVVVYLER